jgi:phenylalanyl-tRNA synthetase beta chain
MKISLNWIFDHIKGELSRIDISQLVDTFIKTTAEIEDWRKVGVSVEALTFVEVINVGEDSVTVHSPEYKKEYILPKRTDAAIGLCFLVMDSGNTKRWATSLVFGGVKEMVLPAIHCPEHMRAGGWKSTIELQDYIVEVDNKSINSRPDLWGHRGLAREIAAILNLPLRPLEEFVTKKDSVTYKNSVDASAENLFDIAINATDACDRFAMLYLSSVQARPSDLHMVVRLSRLDSRAIDFLVDATNYVMLDMGQPMHAFDADTLQKKRITVAFANDKEKLALLDGETVELTSQDLVITDGDKAISLAGIMGGTITGISSKTRSVLLEAAHFDPVVIRRTAARHKKRTESSMRFEKNIDPCQNTDAITRFLFLLDKARIPYSTQDHIVSLGVLPEAKIIMIQHAFIEARLGVLIKSERIIEILEKLYFGVEQSIEDDLTYAVIVPSFRATKDVKIPEDIVEEIGRYIGYDTLPRVMPSLQLRSHDLHVTYITRAIKRFLSYGLQMRELYGYSFFDESVLRQLAWRPTYSIEIKNPISENYTRLVTTLQPNLLKAIGENSIAHTQLRFYEWARVWYMHDENMIEQKSLSGIFFSQKADEIDFYTGKALLSRMFDELHMNVIWQKNDDSATPWNMQHRTAVLVHDDQTIGIAGMVEQSVINELSPAGGSAFIFEINADYLLKYRKPIVRFNALSKYPSVRRDVSMLIGVSATTDMLIKGIKEVDKRIESVALIDFFTKPEWKDQKAMTFHVEIGDKEKTLTSQEVDEIWNRVIAQLQQQGAVIR